MLDGLVWLLLGCLLYLVATFRWDRLGVERIFFSYFMQNNAEMLAKVIKVQQKAIIYGIFCLIL